MIHYDSSVRKTLVWPRTIVLVVIGVFLFSFGLSPANRTIFFPRTDPGQFVINVKAPSGTRIELTDEYVARIEAGYSQRSFRNSDLGMIVSNIGTAPGFSSMYSSNSGASHSFIQVSLDKDHRIRPLRI